MALAPALLAGLAAMPDELDGVVRQVAASKLRFRPASWEGSPGEPFSVLEHVCHLRGLLHYLRSHDQQHLACIHWLIGRMASPGAGPRG